ncbi:MAG: DUF3098 domain-containing protein [Flavobacteriales bacterium]
MQFYEIIVFKMTIKKSTKLSGSNHSNSDKLQFVMTPLKYRILILGIATLFLGYALMSGGGNPDPAVFDESIFSYQRITLAPIVVLIGYCLVGASIMYSPSKPSQS